MQYQSPRVVALMGLYRNTSFQTSAGRFIRRVALIPSSRTCLATIWASDSFALAASLLLLLLLLLLLSPAILLIVDGMRVSDGAEQSFERCIV